MASMLDKLVEIGRIVSTHGIKGELKIRINSDLQLNKSLENLNLFLIDSNNNIDVYKVKKEYFIKLKHIISLENIDDINIAKKFVNQKIYCLKEDNVIDQVLNFINYKVIYNNQEYGTIIDQMDNGVYDLVKIQDTKNRQYWIPVVDVYVTNINIEENQLEVIDIEGLI